MNAVIIPRAEAGKFRQIQITWFKGIDAVELKDGTFFISEQDYNDLPADITIINDAEESVSAKEELSKLPVVDLKDTDFKEPGDITGTEIIEK